MTLAAPAGTTEQTTIALSWGGSDPSGVASFDLDRSLNGGPFAAWLTATKQTAASFEAAPGNRYRFRVRARDQFGNASEFVSSGELSVVAPRAGQPPRDEPPATGPPLRSSPELEITRVTRRRHHLRVSGTVGLGANGKVEASWTARSHGHRRTARASTYAQLRAFTLTIRIPPAARAVKRAALRVTYVGGHDFARQTVRTTVRSR